MASIDTQGKQETPADYGKSPAGVAAQWISALDLADKDKHQRAWREVCKSIIAVYEAEAPEDAVVPQKRRKFQLLWSNIETLSPAVYARTPVAVVGRRFKDSDPVGRIASEVLERAINFQVDAIDFADVMTGVRLDFLLLARAVSWVRYVPHMKTVQPPAPGAPEPANPEGQVTSDAYEVVDWEEAIPDHVSYDDFLHGPARKWMEVPWVSRRVFMTRDELRGRFKPEIADKVPLDHGPSEDVATDQDAEQWKKATVFEIWDKCSRQVFWISKGYTAGPLDQRDDPLKLQDFFPCPRPLLGTRSPRSLVPRPDYVYYESQAKDINELTARIGRLTDQLRMRGFYAAGNEAGKKLQDLLEQDTGVLVPIESWQALADNGGVDKLIAWLPLDVLVATLKSCIDARKQLIDDVMQITGIADIMRGDVDPDETATATRTKATWGSSRVRDKQKELARFARDTLRLMAQIIATKFSSETLSQMTNVQLFPTEAAKQQAIQAFQAQMAQWQQAAQRAQQAGQQPPPQPQPPPGAMEMAQKPTWEDVQGLLQNNVLRAFRIDVETDSTIEPDDQDEKQRRVEFITAVSQFVEKAIPAVQLMPQMLPVITQSLLFLVRGFRVGREMEETIEKALEQLQAAGAPQQQQQHPPGPNPQVEQMKGQAAMIGAQAKMTDAQTRQFEAQTNRYEAQAGAQLEGQRIHAEDMRSTADRQADVHMHGQSIASDLQQAVVRGVERQLTHDIASNQPMKVPTP